MSVPGALYKLFGAAPHPKSSSPLRFGSRVPNVVMAPIIHLTPANAEILSRSTVGIRGAEMAFFATAPVLAGKLATMSDSSRLVYWRDGASMCPA